MGSCTRRVILVAFWSQQARQTVTKNANHSREVLPLSSLLDFEPPKNDHPPGPLPPLDHCGYKVAITMAVKSIQPRRHSDSYIMQRIQSASLSLPTPIKGEVEEGRLTQRLSR